MTGVQTCALPIFQFEVNAFVKVLDSHPGVICMATETIKPYQLPREGLQMDFDGERFLDLLHHYPRADAVVSFVGAPKLTPKQMSELPARLPKLLAVGRRRKEVRVLFEKRLLDVLIVPRYTFPSPQGEPKTMPAWFEKYFQIVTSVDQLPSNDRK